jgi:ribosomal protein S6
MTKLADDPKTLAKLIASLGGTVPKINAMGLGVRKISERVAQDQNGTHNVMTLALYKPAKKENDIERVMRARGIG